MYDTTIKLHIYLRNSFICLKMLISMEIIFIRHAEKIKEEGDLGLSETGKIQAKNLAKRIGKLHFDEIYSSNLNRAKETAKIVGKKIKLKPQIEESLNEFESNLLKIKKEDWDNESKSHYESLEYFLSTFNKRADEDKRVLIIAHGLTNRLILAIMLELELKNLVRFRLLETGICEIYWMPKFKNWRLKYWNDVSHQPKELIEGENKY